MNNQSVILETSCQDFACTRGKVRDIYDLSGWAKAGRLLIVVTDRISAFDVVMPNGIPYKGVVLTEISRFWFEKFADLVANHMISCSLADLPPAFAENPDTFAGRCMLVHKADVVPIECVVRGYLAGSGWKEYKDNGTVCGIKLPVGLKQCDKLPEPIFTPATKATSGHDENISFEQACQVGGKELITKLRQLSIQLYSQAAHYAADRGIIIADTKFEWGMLDGKVMLIDEALTPDSSRFWPADQYQPGRDQSSFDKQYVRNYLEGLDWDKTPPGPELPDHVVAGTEKRYTEAYERLTGKTFNPQQIGR